MFARAVMTLYSQRDCATLRSRMRKTAGPAAHRGPGSLLSSRGPITLFNNGAPAKPLYKAALVGCRLVITLQSASVHVAAVDKCLLAKYLTDFNETESNR